MLVIGGVQLWDWSIWWLIATLSLLGVRASSSHESTLSLIKVPAHVSRRGAVMQPPTLGTSVGAALSSLFGGPTYS